MYSASPGFRSARTLSLIAIVGLVLVAVFDVFKLVMGVGGAFLPERTVDLSGHGMQSLWLLMQSMLAVFELPVFIATVVFFLIWLYRVFTNLPSLRTPPQEFSPGWAVGWWFIPFANLVKPFQAVREVWFDSDPVVDNEPVFLSASLRSAPTFMVLWWIFWITSNVVANIASRVFDIDRMETVAVSSYLFILEGILSVVAAVLAIKVVRDTTRRQEQRLANLGSLHQYSPPAPPTFDADSDR